MLDNFWKKLVAASVFTGIMALAVLAYDWRLISRFVSAPADIVARASWFGPDDTVQGGIVSILPQVTSQQATIGKASLDAAMEYAEKNRSVALIVYRNGRLELEKYWPPYTSDMRTDSAAMHKALLGLLVGVALRDKVISSIDDRVANYIPEWANDERRDITIRDLLQMSSGLAPLPVTSSPFSAGNEILFSSNINDIAISDNLAHKPHTIFDYNNANSQILEEILERQSGQRYAQYLSNEIWQDIGTRAASVWLDRPKGEAHVFCCIQMTALDWMKVGILFLNQGKIDNKQIVPASWIRAMTTPSAVNPNYGLHVWLGSPYVAERRFNEADIAVHSSEPYAANGLYFFDGAGGQRVYIVPSANLVIVRIGMAALNWDDSVLPNTILRGIINEPAEPSVAR